MANVFRNDTTYVRTVRPDARDVLEVGPGNVVTNVGARTIQYDEANDFASPTSRTTGQSVTTTVPIFVRVTAGQGKVSIKNVENLSVEGLDSRVDAVETDHAKYLTGSETKDWGSVADGANATEAVTVTGAALGDFVEGVSMSVDVNTGVILHGRVSAADTVTVTFANESGGAVDLGTGTLRVRVRKV